MNIPTMMHVDADPSAGQMLHDAVMVQGGRHRFTQFTCGPAAVAQLIMAEGDEKKGHPTVLVVDMDVDDGRGLEFIISVRSVLDLARIPILLLHSGNHRDDLLVAYQLGISGVIEKPRAAMQWMDLADEINREYLKALVHRDEPALTPLYGRRVAMAEACRH